MPGKTSMLLALVRILKHWLPTFNSPAKHFNSLQRTTALRTHFLSSSHTCSQSSGHHGIWRPTALATRESWVPAAPVVSAPLRVLLTRAVSPHALALSCGSPHWRLLSRAGPAGSTSSRTPPPTAHAHTPSARYGVSPPLVANNRRPQRGRPCALFTMLGAGLWPDDDWGSGRQLWRASPAWCRAPNASEARMQA